MSQLKQRIITGSLLAIAVILGIFFLPNFAFLLFTALILVLAGWEWGGLIQLKYYYEKIIFLVILLITFFCSYYFLKILPYIIAVAWWCYATYLVYQYPRKNSIWLQNKNFAYITGIILLVPAMLGLNALRQLGVGYLLLALFLIWSMDTGAYFAGRRFGKHKLAPNVSPGKTIEGLIGGLILTSIMAIIALSMLHEPLTNWPGLLVLSLITATLSVIGDLFESMVKRQANVKDSGTILPGHGGILDRIDSLTAAIPIFTLGLLLLK